jgi:hypothetical protein
MFPRSGEREKKLRGVMQHQKFHTVFRVRKKGREGGKEAKREKEKKATGGR